MASATPPTPFGIDDKITPVQGSPASVASTLANSAELDDNYDLYKRSDEQEFDVAESKRVLRKVDLRIVPILFLIYLMQYLDKNGINYASVYGLQKGTNLHGQDYSWLGSIFYFGARWSTVPSPGLARSADGDVVVVQVISGPSIPPDICSNDCVLAR